MSADDHTEKRTPEDVKTKAFWVAFEMIFVFGLPAAGAVLISRWLLAEGIAGEWVMYLALGLAFVISWVIVFIRVRQLSADFDTAESVASDSEADEVVDDNQASNSEVENH